MRLRANSISWRRAETSVWASVTSRRMRSSTRARSIWADSRFDRATFCTERLPTPRFCSDQAATTSRSVPRAEGAQARRGTRAAAAEIAGAEADRDHRKQRPHPFLAQADFLHRDLGAAGNDFRMIRQRLVQQRRQVPILVHQFEQRRHALDASQRLRRVRIEQSAQLGRGDANRLLGPLGFRAQQHRFRAGTLGVGVAPLLGLGEIRGEPFDLHEFLQRLPIRLLASLRSTRAR